MKWLYFRSAANSINDDNGLISNHSTSNSSLRTSVCLRYDNLQSILPFDDTQDEHPNGGSDADYTGIVMVFKSSNMPNGKEFIISADNIDTNFLQTDRIYLEVNSNSLAVCGALLNSIENSEENYIVVRDEQTKTGEGVIISIKHIEIPHNYSN